MRIGAFAKKCISIQYYYQNAGTLIIVCYMQYAVCCWSTLELANTPLTLFAHALLAPQKPRDNETDIKVVACKNKLVVTGELHLYQVLSAAAPCSGQQ